MLTRRSVFALGLVVLTACAAEPPAPDTAELERWLRRYVELLNSADEAGLTAHLNRAGTTEAADRIGRHGRRGLVVDGITSTSEFDRVYRVRIEATAADGQRVTMDETAEWDGTRWMIAPLAA
ncbi:hypothetical protein ACQPW3_20185 [Actinosynnema sp. CA-248983]